MMLPVITSSIRGTSSGSIRALKSLLLGATLVLDWSASADAAQSILLQFPNIIGTSTIVGHVGDIILTGYAASASNATTVGSATGGAGAGKVTCGQITLVKPVDQTSVPFLKLLLTGARTAGPATIIFESTTGAKPFDYYKVALQDIFVTSITQSDPQDTGVTETIVLVATKFSYTYTPPPNSGLKPFNYSFNCATNQAT